MGMTMLPSPSPRMKFYDETQMKPLRETLEKKITRWPDVERREMMGCLCYFRGRKFFTFLVTKGIVLTKLSEDDRSNLPKQLETKPFEMSGRTARSWIRITVRKPEDLQPLLPYVKKSYEASGK